MAGVMVGTLRPGNQQTHQPLELWLSPCGSPAHAPSDNKACRYGQLEKFNGQSGYFVARAVSHICAPGFSFLMGLGMTMFASSRIDRGWTAAAVLRHFLTRGVLLICFGFVVRASGLIDLADDHPRGD